MQQKFAEGVDLSENGQAMDAIREVGPGQPLSRLRPHAGQFRDRLLPLRRSPTTIPTSNGWPRARRRAEQRANELARRWLGNYEAPPLDPGIDEALKDFIAKKKASMPDAFT